MFISLSKTIHLTNLLAINIVKKHDKQAKLEKGGDGEEVKIKVVTLKAIEATSQTFKDYGQVIQSSLDSEEFGLYDAKVKLSRGTPGSCFSLHF